MVNRWEHHRALWLVAVPPLFLLALTYFIFGSVLAARPFDQENLYILSWVAHAPASALFRLDPTIYPEWRPLAFQTVWLQYRWSTIDNIAAYFMVNLVLWMACGWLVFRIVDLITGSALTGLIAASLLLSDGRAVPALTWIVDRQISMACLFSLVALLTVTRTWDRGLTRLEWSGVVLCLLASALSKEYGLAVAGAFAIYAIGSRRWDLGTAALVTVLAYAGLRAWFAGDPTTTGYCPDSGYFFGSRHQVCANRFDTTALKQMTYNVAATALGTVLPGFLFEDGNVGMISRLRLASSAVWLAVAALGWMKGSRPIWLTFLIIPCTAVLSFMAYRERNQLVALCGLMVAFGVGLTYASAGMRAGPRSHLIRGFALVAMLLLVSVQVVRTRALLTAEVSFQSRLDPCNELAKNTRVDRNLVGHLKLKYGMSNPECSLQH